MTNKCRLIKQLIGIKERFLKMFNDLIKTKDDFTFSIENINAYDSYNLKFEITYCHNKYYMNWKVETKFTHFFEIKIEYECIFNYDMSKKHIYRGYL